jgi:putative transposase
MIEAQVVLPDHIHALWTLPDGDSDYPTRWRLIKEAFTREYVATGRVQEPDPPSQGERRTRCVAAALLGTPDP